MAVTREVMKEEAIERMNILNLHPNVIKEFTEKDTLNYSYSELGFLYWLTDETQARVEKFERETEYLVYHVIEDETTIGRLITLLYVSTCDDEWESDKEDLRAGQCIAYVVNKEDEMFSEFGSVGLKSINGGVVRTA